MIQNILSNIRYIFFLSFGVFWGSWVAILEVITLIKNPISYWKSPSSVKYPDCVNDKKYGISCKQKIKTTKGVGLEDTEIELHYMISGEDNSKTILFIHGFPEFWFSYRYQITEFNRDYRVIALDLRGYGKSSKPADICDYQLKHLANDVKGLMDAIGLKSAIVVAHDWGGVVGWELDRAYPNLVEKYITINIPESRAFQKIITSNVKQFLNSWYIMFFQLPWFPEWVLSRMDLDFIEQAFTSPRMGMRKTRLSSDELLAFKANMALDGALRSGINYYRASVQYGAAAKLGRQGKSDSNSTSGRYMLVFGTADGALCVETAMETAKMLPRLRLKLLPGVSHWAQQDDPDTVNKLIRDFLGIENPNERF